MSFQISPRSPAEHPPILARGLCQSSASRVSCILTQEPQTWTSMTILTGPQGASDENVAFNEGCPVVTVEEGE